MKKRNFSAEFKRESAQLVVDQNYTVADAAKALLQIVGGDKLIIPFC
ncbi:hypothetical protein [Escherichia coli]